MATSTYTSRIIQSTPNLVQVVDLVVNGPFLTAPSVEEVEGPLLPYQFGNVTGGLNEGSGVLPDEYYITPTGYTLTTPGLLITCSPIFVESGSGPTFEEYFWGFRVLGTVPSVLADQLTYRVIGKWYKQAEGGTDTFDLQPVP